MHEAERVIPDARHEPTDIGPGFIWGAVAVCVGTILACALLVLWLYPNAKYDRALDLPLPIYPEPRLQPSPPDDMQSFYGKEMQILNTTGWVDKAGGVVHIPISQAMREVAQDGIAGWPSGAAQSAP